MPLTPAGETTLTIEALRSLADKAEALIKRDEKRPWVEMKYGEDVRPQDVQELFNELESAVAWARKVLEGG